MDSFTQIVLGAAVGEAVAGKKLGNKAPLFGAIAGTLPDLDVYVGKAMTTVGALDFHRGFTHSLLFALLFAPLFGLLMRKLFKNNRATFKDWTLLFFLGFFTHALLDCFTTWGTQLFWPFDYRVAFKSIFVIDPLYTLPLFICLVWLMLLPRDSKCRLRLNQVGLLLSSGYLAFTITIKQHFNHVFEQSFASEQMEVLRYDTRPAPLNTLLWTANAETSDSFYTGYYSILDDDQKIEYFYFPKRHELLAPYLHNTEVQRLVEITNNWYALKETNDGVILNDLRFGQRTGWLDQDGAFVFSYHIYEKYGAIHIDEVENEMNDGKALANSLWARILGREQRHKHK